MERYLMILVALIAIMVGCRPQTSEVGPAPWQCTFMGASSHNPDKRVCIMEAPGGTLIETYDGLAYVPARASIVDGRLLWPPAPALVVTPEM